MTMNARRILIRSLICTVVAIPLALFVNIIGSGQFIHSGADTTYGLIAELTWIWPMFIIRDLDISGPPAFFLLCTMAAAGYFVFFAILLTVIDLCRTVATRHSST